MFDREARDALTAFFYVRSLTLVPGAIVSEPLNEGGSNLVLQVAPAQHETIDVAGSRARTLRLEPRRPIRMTIWLSDDERRLPLRVFVDAGFGRVRADLVDYRQ